MRMLRIAGLIVILLVALGGAVDTAQATAPVNCWSYCSGVFYTSQCWVTLSQCCTFNSRCPKGYVYEGGDCTDGTNYCP